MATMVERWNVERDGPMTEAGLREKLEERGYRVAKYVYPAGTSFPRHMHMEHKIDAVLAGRFRICTESGCVELEAGDYVYVPAGAPHSAEVLGEEPVVSLDAVEN